MLNGPNDVFVFHTDSGVVVDIWSVRSLQIFSRGSKWGKGNKGGGC